SGFEFIAKYALNRAVDFTGNANAFRTNFHGSAEHNIAANEGFSWNANLTTNVKFTKNLSGQVKFEYQAPRILFQGKGLDSYVIDGGVRWDILSKRASVNFNVRDLLEQRRWGGYTRTATIYREYEN